MDVGQLMAEIEAAAVDASTEVGVILRKCLVLSARISLAELKTWAEHELSGYSEAVELPPYRVIAAEPRGYFIGGGMAGELQIPLTALPEKLRNRFHYLELRQSITNLEETVEAARRKGQGELNSQWPTEIVAMYCSRIYSNATCLAAWSEFSIGQVRGAVEAVRNRVLSFVLRLRDEIPELSAEKLRSADAMGNAKQIFNTVIMGNVSHWNAAGDTINISFRVEKGDWQQLAKVLSEAGVAAQDLEELRAAIDQEGTTEDVGFGSRVQAWIGRMVAKAADGSWDVSVGAAGQLIGVALGKFFGLSN